MILALMIRSRGAMVARLTPDQKIACSNHVRINLPSPCIMPVNFEYKLIGFAWGPKSKVERSAKVASIHKCHHYATRIIFSHCCHDF